MKRRDARSRYVIVWLAVMLSAGLVGWILRGPVGTALAGWDAAHVCARLGLLCFLLVSILLAGGAVWWAVAHHLRLLRLAGLVTTRREGKEVFYRVADTELARSMHRMIEEVLHLSCTNQER